MGLFLSIIISIILKFELARESSIIYFSFFMYQSLFSYIRNICIAGIVLSEDFARCVRILF